MRPQTRKGYEPKTAHGSAVRCPVFSVDSGREKRSLYSLAHLPSAGVQEEERASLFPVFSRFKTCFQVLSLTPLFWLKATVLQ